MRIALISANLSGIDNKYESSYLMQELPEDWKLDYFLINDSNFPQRINSLHPRLQAKIPKMLAFEMFPGYDYYIWLDGSVNIINTNSIYWLINSCLGYEIVSFKHPLRNSIQEELNYMLNLMKNGNRYLMSRYDGEPIIEQVSLYLSDDGFIDNRLFSLGIFAYHKSLIEKNFLNNWFYHNARYSVQDQLSFPYLLNKFNLKINIITDNIFQNSYFSINSHQ